MKLRTVKLGYLQHVSRTQLSRHRSCAHSGLQLCSACIRTRTVPHCRRFHWIWGNPCIRTLRNLRYALRQPRGSGRGTLRMRSKARHACQEQCCYTCHIRQSPGLHQECTSKRQPQRNKERDGHIQRQVRRGRLGRRTRRVHNPYIRRMRACFKPCLPHLLLRADIKLARGIGLMAHGLILRRCGGF